MSLGIVIKGPEGLVLAAESRVTLESKFQDGKTLHVNFDNATKLLSFGELNNAVGAVVYGLPAIGFRNVHSFIPEFESNLKSERLSVSDFSNQLSGFFMKQWKIGMSEDYKGPNMTFVVGGFDKGEPYGKVFQFDIPSNPIPKENSPSPGEFGITWGGQREFVDRLIQGFDNKLSDIVAKSLNLNAEQINLLNNELKILQMQIPLNAMSLQDCVDLAIFFLRTTIDGQRLTVGIRGCGGPIDVATITRRDGLNFIQKKKIKGEFQNINEFFEG